MPFLLFAAAITLVATGFYSAVRKRDRRATAEEGRDPNLEIRCGVQLDRFGATWPFARLALYDTFLVLSSEGGTFVLRYRNIERVEIERTLVGTGLRVVHTETGVPRSVLIWTAAQDEIHSRLVPLVLPKPVTDEAT